MARDAGGMSRGAKGRRGGGPKGKTRSPDTVVADSAADSGNASRPSPLRRFDPSPLLFTLAGVSIALFALRIYASSVVGFGDSEALYACFAAHPQPAFLDHPGLIGLVARAIGEGAIPTPVRVHAVTTVVVTLIPWLVYGVARALGADRGRAAIAGLVIALCPETAVGLFALTPDLLLAPAWFGVLALAGIGMTAEPHGNRSAFAFLGAGVLAGAACAAKVSGGLLMIALVATYLWVAFARSAEGATEHARRCVRTLWPWAGVAAGIVIVMPIALFEAKTGWPMLQHRFVDTQAGAGFGGVMRNLGVLLGGQVAYVSPLFLFLAVLAARDLWRERTRDAISRLLFSAVAVPLLPLLAFCLWSPVAEPHWIAPALLALPLHVARRAGQTAFTSRRMFIAAGSVAAAFTLAVHAYVLLPASVRIFPASADPKVDIASELYGWPTAVEAIREQMASQGTPFDPEGREVVVVGPHWTVCSQLHAALPGIRVGCATPIRDDFDDWLPRDHWRAAEHVLFVTDNRFPGDGSEQLPGHVKVAQSRVRVLRGGRGGRVFELYLYDRRAQGMR